MSGAVTMPGLSRAGSPSDMVHRTLSFHYGDLPELVHELRREVVRMLQEYADAEPNPLVARRLREIAAEFDAGLHLELEDLEGGADGEEG